MARTARSATRRAFARWRAGSHLLGFDGKWAIHPDQIALCNEIFSPTPTEYERAVRILEAYEQATGGDRVGAVVFEGEMIDEASRKMALQVVARGRATGAEQ